MDVVTKQGFLAKNSPENGERGRSLLCGREALASAARRGRNLWAALSEKRALTIFPTADGVTTNIGRC